MKFHDTWSFECFLFPEIPWYVKYQGLKHHWNSTVHDDITDVEIVAKLPDTRKLQHVYCTKFDDTFNFHAWYWKNCPYVSDPTSQFRQIFTCLLCFAQFLAFLHMAPISRKTTVTQSFLTPISSNSTFRTVFWTSLIENDISTFSARFWLFSNFEQQDSGARCLTQLLAS